MKQTAVEWLVQEINKINASTEAKRFINKLEKQAKEIEKEQQNEFAIGFGQWLVSNCYSEDDIYWWLIKTGGDVRKSTEELLEIYKKEKGL
jgi:methanogenic corrinoid protein MtbC1